MKIDNLLAQYLYQYKKLALPGIGTFTIDENTVFPDEHSRVRSGIEGIGFSPKTTTADEDSLIKFIQEQTGKMRPLAQSDLDSYTMLAMQFLNIGKPFFIEGVGTLNKVKEGILVFQGGTPMSVKTSDLTEKQADAKNNTAYFDNKPSDGNAGANMKRLLVFLAVATTLGLIIWGGLYLYESNTAASEAAPVTVAADTSALIKAQDTAAITVTDSTLMPPLSTSPPASQAAASTLSAGEYKFVFETTNKARALKRYEYLRQFSKTQIETTDSITYKLFMVLARSAADTTRVKDSLNAWYYGSGPIRITIQH